ncbi:RNA polymerase sigma factor SigI [Clostridium homopropionicum DSM 5847]|uniref:RNA polymerase sigma factor SigI n=1 Tax=Clostridium homopropionicum DSM 5847 TaxID=1121318 RepID=A0A0L6Z7Q2_9CLOT|nr:sigma factor [Clostridium homopropionicum]KOA18997.1 RNA polymerase sigma factor SigI [Clostridium homopropionicum DSM 5847]SFG42203.1 RNA polymerase sigma factor [Clostridium homopropionicum]
MDPMSPILENRDSFIENNKNFIYGAAYKVCKRKLDWTNDEELSISLIAFNDACDKYSEEKGNFFSFASVIIKNALIDFFRKANNTPYLTFDNSSEDNKEDYIDYKISIDNYQIETENKKRAEEIALFSQELANYKLSFSALVESSPSHVDTRNNLLNLAIACSKDNNILDYIKNKKLLPIAQIALLTNTKKKYLEKWRRYLLTLILILSTEEYPYIKSYLNIKVGENND